MITARASARFFIIVALAALASACYRAAPAVTPPAPVVIEGRDAEFAATCEAIYLSELGRPIDPSGASACLARARAGATGAELTEWVRTASDEYAKRQERLERERREAEERARAFRGPLRTRGTRFIDAKGDPYQAIWLGPTVTKLTAAERNALLDFAADPDGDPATPGFNGVIGFFGRIAWHQQSAEDAIAALPAWLADTRRRGMHLVIIAITDSRDGGYDEIEHLRRIAAMTAAAENVALIVANEPYHGTQSALVNDLAGLCESARRALAGYPHPWALGAGHEDAPIGGRYSGACGSFSTVHVGRGGSPADILERMNGLAQIAAATGRPVVSGEMIGAAEQDVPGRRIGEPAFFGRAGHRIASLGAGGGFHSESGLRGMVPGPVQRRAAQAFIDGSHLPPVTIPVPEPRDPCADAPADAEAIVGCARRQFAPGHLSKSDLASLMRSIALTLNVRGVAGGPYGVLVKTSGNNCGGYSCDIVCTGNGPGQRQFDVLIDETDPTWRPVTGPIRVDVCEPVGPEAREPWTPAQEGSLGAYPIPPIVGMTSTVPAHRRRAAGAIR